ncbi:MAG: hypothetical protein KGJ23_12560 [Euryarchaeota archaeon]|nr:hypothetical protein [Euryarchaeota archaeon]MDE1837430.1 hypothetical protein [Euryarchaeota archaeon]MDE1881955.1 hypothetical protein [Euryarchaeota archaeon]MDE2045604.1 hypothetical protein [Thermoplasmata archaeon]
MNATVRTLGDSDDDAPESEKLLKTTVLLPHDTVAMLDELAAQAGFGSRGRTIQAMVDSMPAAVVALKHLQKTLDGFNPKTQADLATIVSKLMLNIMPLFQAFGRFVPLE